FLFIYILFFFFSSRRRHTRSKRDWSSDVCSSDLLNIHANISARGNAINAPITPPEIIFLKAICGIPNLLKKPACSIIGVAIVSRSEERRVGKECRCRWWGDD